MNSMTDKKILVTGADGQLGRSLRKAFRAKGFDNVSFTDVAELDITDREKVDLYVRGNGFTHIINCAAYTQVDKAETESLEAARLNTESVGIIADIASKYKVKVLHISTDYVFSGESCRPYAENDEPYPQSIYGRTKLDGEGILTAFCPDAIIIRTSWLYSEYGVNFVRKMLELASKEKELMVVSDQIGSPTYAADLADVILTIVLADKWESGIYHYSNEGAASWYDFAKAIFRISNISIPVKAVPSKDFVTKARRPLYSVLSKEKIKKTFGLDIPHWEESLAKCLASGTTD